MNRDSKASAVATLALALLDQSQEGRSPLDTGERASDLLEDLLGAFGEPSAEKEAAPPKPDPAEVQRRQALFENRIGSIQRRLDVNPEDVDALFAKGTYLAMQKRYPEAVQALDRVTKLNPRYPGVWFLKAKVHQALGNVKVAELCPQRAAEMEAER